MVLYPWYGHFKTNVIRSPSPRFKKTSGADDDEGASCSLLKNENEKVCGVVGQCECNARIIHAYMYDTREIGTALE